MVFYKKIILFILLIIIVPNAYGNIDDSNRIEVLVNENVITKYDIVQRIKINAILKRIEINENNYNQIMNAVVDDLVVEKLKLKKIEEYNINFDSDEFTQHENRFYSSLEFTKEDLEELFLLNSINYNNLLEFIAIELKWQKLIYGLYLRVTSVTEQEIFDFMNKNPNVSEETANEIILQKQLDLKSLKLIKDLRSEATIEYK